MTTSLKLIILFSLTLLSCATRQNRTKPVITFVTGLWDIKRISLESKFKRSFDYYLNYFKDLLETQSNLIIFGDGLIQDFVSIHRKRNNTIFIHKQLQWFRGRWYYPHIQRIVKKVEKEDPETFKFISGYPQYGLELYDPVVMSKVYLMQEALAHDNFNSEQYVWVDGGFTHVYDKRHIVPADNSIQRIPLYYQGPIFFHTNDANQLQYGYASQGLDYLQNLITQFVWANFFGSKVEAVSTFSSVYENIMRVTLEKSDLWTEESLFSLMINRYPYFAVALFNISLTDFDYFRFNYPQYEKTQEIRYFKLSSINNTLHCSQTVVDRGVVIFKDSHTDLALKEILQYRYSQQFLQDTLKNYHQQFAIFIKHIVKISIVNVFILGIYIYVRCSLRNYDQAKNYQAINQDFI